MPLGWKETTPVTEAIENGTNAAVAFLTELGGDAERLVSEVTRNGGKDATAAGYVVNASRLWVTWLNGLAMLSNTAADNVALVASTVPRYFISSAAYPQALPPGGPWRLRVDEAAIIPFLSEKLPSDRLSLIDSEDNRIDTTSAESSTVDSTWDRQLTVVLRHFPYTPGAVRLKVTPVSSIDNSPATQETLHLGFAIEPSLLHP